MAISVNRPVRAPRGSMLQCFETCLHCGVDMSSSSEDILCQPCSFQALRRLGDVDVVPVSGVLYALRAAGLFVGVVTMLQTNGHDAIVVSLGDSAALRGLRILTRQHQRQLSAVG